MAVGDVMLGRSIGSVIRREGPDAVFAGVADELDEAELLVVNVECVIAAPDTGMDAPKRYILHAPPEAAEALASIGTDVASLANNHAGDRGDAGLLETARRLARDGVAVAGAGRDIEGARAPAVVEVEGLRLAFLGYVAPMGERSGFHTGRWEATHDAAGVAIAAAGVVRRDVIAARERADVVVVMLHAGTEYAARPNTLQHRIARAAAEAGAALVLGHHSHRLQGLEWKGETLVAHGLGNFVFDRMVGPDRESAILDVTIDRTGVRSVDAIPVELVDGLPVPASPSVARRVSSRLESLGVRLP